MFLEANIVSLEEPEQKNYFRVESGVMAEVVIVVVSVDLVEVAITRRISSPITFTGNNNIVGTMKTPLKGKGS
ncbi:hypothetical protein OROGR_029819 [Orobanche gracilis]